MIEVHDRTIPWSSFDELIRDKARRHGDAVFAEVASTPISYRALEEKSRCIGDNLRREGVAPGDRVASFMFNAVEQLLLMFAVPRVKAIWTPINGGLMAGDLAYTLRDSGARILVVDQELRPRLDLLPADCRNGLRVFVAGDDPGSDRAFAYLMRPEAALEPIPTAPGDPAIILYTGGTTGLPKGVVLPQLSFVLAGIRYGESFSVVPGERHFTTLPLFHAAALQFGVMGPLVNDMTTVIDRRFGASDYFHRVRATGANVIDPIGTMVGLLCAQPETPRDRDHHVRVGVGIVGQVPPAIPAAFTRRFAIPLVAIYGLTEAGGAMITANRLGAAKEGTVGQSFGWAELRIGDDNDVALPPGRIGQILLRPNFPDMFMIGYHNNPAKTLEAFRNLWLHTGDLGSLDDAGTLTFVGRQAHWIRRRGENVSAYEVEEILSTYPGIAEVVVVGVPSPYGEDDIKAFLIAAPGQLVDPARLVEWCAARLAAFKVPRFVEIVDDFPRSVTKREVERAVLKKMPNDTAWDREAALGRVSSQSSRSRADG